MKKLLLPHQYYYPHMDFFYDRATGKKSKEFIDKLDEVPQYKKDAMIYIHIPFCDSKCAFCGFDKVYALDEVDKYIDNLLNEIELFCSKKYIQNLNVKSIHFGGGTPTILTKDVFSKIINRLKENFNLEKNIIINIEGSATTLYKDEIIELILENKISRISVGVQSFNEKLRNEFKIKASIDEVYLTLSKLKENKIMKYIDILYGNPDFGIGNMSDIIRDDIKKAVELEVEGIDFSQLYPFSNSLENRINNNELSLPSSNEVVNIILNSTKIMESAGYYQSTAYGFIKDGDIIIETSYYGRDEKNPDCIAFGSGAFGKLNGFKYRNVSYNAYINKTEIEFSQIKKFSNFETERAHIIGFPRVLELSKDRISQELMLEFGEKFKYLIDLNLIEETTNKFILSKKGKCFVDNIYYYLVDDKEKELINKQLKIITLN